MINVIFRTFFYFFSPIAVIVLGPSAALAVQAHGGAEGLVAHQFGHALFIVGISYLLYKVYSARIENIRWIEFKIFLWLLICWNFLTLTGHWMNEFVEQNKFSMVDNRVIAMTIDGWWDFLFYLTRLDHLLLVPSFLCLFLALRKWRGQA